MPINSDSEHVPTDGKLACIAAARRHEGEALTTACRTRCYSLLRDAMASTARQMGIITAQRGGQVTYARRGRIVEADRQEFRCCFRGSATLNDQSGTPAHLRTLAGSASGGSSRCRATRPRSVSPPEASYPTCAVRSQSLRSSAGRHRFFACEEDLSTIHPTRSSRSFSTA